MQSPDYDARASDSSPSGSISATPIELAHQALARMIIAATLGAPPEGGDGMPSPQIQQEGADAPAPLRPIGARSSGGAEPTR